MGKKSCFYSAFACLLGRVNYFQRFTGYSSVQSLFTPCVFVLYVCACTHVCQCVCMSVQCMLVAFFYHSSPCTLTVSPLNLELPSKLQGSAYLFLSLQYWNQRPLHLCLALYVNARDLNSGLHAPM